MRDYSDTLLEARMPTAGTIPAGVILSVQLDPYLPLKALSGYCGMSVRKLRDFLDDPVRPLPCYRIGGKLLVRRSEFDAWIAAFRKRRSEDLDRIVAESLRDLS
jgi:Helix-turn-helix domain